MSTESAVALDSLDEMQFINAIDRVHRGESTYEWVDASLTDSDSIHIEVELEQIGTSQNADLILSFLVLVNSSYADRNSGNRSPELLSETSLWLEGLEADLESIISRHVKHPYTLNFERNNSYNGEDTAYAASIISSFE